MVSAIVARFYAGAADKESKILKASVFLFLLGMVALWTVLCGISHSAPDLDGMEELVWASSFELGYYKHPPLPSWFMLGFIALFGKPVWLPFFAGEIFSALALWFVFLLGCEFTTPRRSFIAMLMASAIVYFSLRGTIYNHNTVQLWSIAASTWLFYRALRYRALSSWVWLGVVAALAMLTKYSALIHFSVFFVFLLRFGHFRDRGTRRGVAVALAVFLAVMSPHVFWLFTHSFEPLLYADRSIESSARYVDTLTDILYFTEAQLGRLSSLFVVWVALFYWNKRRGGAAAGGFGPSSPASLETYAAGLSRWDRSFLLWIGLGPFVSTVVISAVLGTQLVASWGTTFFTLYGFYAFWWLAGNEEVNLRRTAVLVIAVHVLMSVGYAIGRGPLAYYSGHPSRSTFPGPAIAAALGDVWHNHVSRVPLRLVASDTWLGGNIAIHTDPRTRVFIDARYNESPWLDPRSALDCGVLVAYSPTTRETPADSLNQLFQQSEWRGTVNVRWSSERSPMIEVNWGIIPPGPDCTYTD